MTERQQCGPPLAVMADTSKNGRISSLSGRLSPYEDETDDHRALR